MLIELITLEGPVFVNPAHVALVSDGSVSTTVMLVSGDEFDVEGSAAEVAQSINTQVF